MWNFFKNIIASEDATREGRTSAGMMSIVFAFAGVSGKAPPDNAAIMNADEFGVSPALASVALLVHWEPVWRSHQSVVDARKETMGKSWFDVEFHENANHIVL